MPITGHAYIAANLRNELVDANARIAQLQAERDEARMLAVEGICHDAVGDEWGNFPCPWKIRAMQAEAMMFTDAQIKHMVDRFLAWRLPPDFDPDNGINYKRPNYSPEVDATPVGTNLLTATQAEAMVRHMLDGLPSPAAWPPGGTSDNIQAVARHAIHGLRRPLSRTDGE